MQYADDIISFEIPEGFSNKVHSGNGSWKGTSKKCQSFQIYPWGKESSRSAEAEFEDYYKRCSSFLERMDITAPKIEGCKRAAYSERILKNEKPPYVEVEVRLLFDNDILVVRIWDHKIGEHFQMDRYMPSIESIELDFDKLHDLLQNIQVEQERQIQDAINTADTEQARTNEEEQVVRAERKPVMSQRAQKILEKLDADSDNPYRFMPDLEHGYFYTAGSRITLFGDGSRWAFVFEKSGYSNRGGSVNIELSYFGNCLSNLETGGMNGMFVCNAKNFTSFETPDLCDDFEIVSQDVETVEICGRAIPIPRDPEIYREHNIELNDPDEIGIVELTRLLVEMYPELFRATEEELRTCIPVDLPQIMVIDHWHHESVYVEEKRMSECEVYQQIAEVLASLDPKKWKPKKKPNNDWRNWPEAGCL